MTYYIAIEQYSEMSEVYRGLWRERGIEGIIVPTITEAMEKAMEIEASKTERLYFVSIVAPDIDYLPQLALLRKKVVAPILIAAVISDDSERTAALTAGADYYGNYCTTPVENINTVIAVINSIKRREQMPNPSFHIMLLYQNLLVAPTPRRVFVGAERIELTRQEFDIIHYLMKNPGRVLTYRQIYRRVWGSEYEDAARDVLWSAVKRLREKLRAAPEGSDYIETRLDVGYCIPLE